MSKINISLEKADFGEKFPEKYEPYLGDYQFTEWNFGDREDIIEQCSVTKRDDKGETVVDLKSGAFRTLVILKCVEKAPFKVTMKSIRELPILIAEWIYSKCSELNDEFSDIEIKK